MQFYVSSSDSDTANRVPFFMQESLGGPDSLRGFDNFRFRDDNLMLISTEYRWEANPYWELALFYDAGKVFPNRAPWNLKDLEKGYGFGVRIKVPHATLFRFDVGHSDEGFIFSFKLSSPSF
jgi:hemolysin activation/secretion protein